MQHLIFLWLPIVLFLNACHPPSDKSTSQDTLIDNKKPQPETVSAASNQTTSATPNTIIGRFAEPSGFRRIETKEGSFGEYLQNLPLKTPGAPVRYYNGQEKNGNGIYLAVVDMDIGEKDLQQCADAIMRLRGEYLLQEKAYDQIHFNFTNGFRAEYSRWRNGDRIKVQGNKVSWYHTNTESKSYQSFRRYMEWVFMYAGTLSLAKELRPVSPREMKIGDVFIQGGSPGHAVIIVDMAVEEISGKKQFILAQSYMPAQDIQVLQNPLATGQTPWFHLEVGQPLVTPEWTFKVTDLKRFH